VKTPEIMIDFLKRVYSKLSIWDMGFLKIYGALFGILVGWYFHEQITSWVPLIVGAFIALMLRFLYVLFVKK